MKKLFLLLMIAILALGCEKEELEPELEINYEAQKVKRYLESTLEENEVGVFLVYEDSLVDSLVVSLIESENLSFELEAEELGLSVDVVFSVNDNINKSKLFYKYEDIDRVGIEFDHPYYFHYNTMMLVLKDTLSVE